MIIKIYRIAATLVSVFAFAFGFVTTGRADAQTPVRNIVLVHGAFADGSSWLKVIPILQAKGFHVTAVQIPLSGLANDLAVVKRALAQQDGPTILVAHSWGGVVITEAGMDDKVVGLVYVAAFGLDAGESINQLAKGAPVPPALAHLNVDAQGFGSIPTNDFLKYFAQDLPEGEARALAAAQGPAFAGSFDDKPMHAAWKTKPSWYIVAKRDGTISPDAERFFAQRMHARTTELDANHVTMLSQPGNVAAVILDAAAKAIP